MAKKGYVGLTVFPSRFLISGGNLFRRKFFFFPGRKQQLSLTLAMRLQDHFWKARES